MKQEIRLEYETYQSLSELEPADRELIDRAREALQQSYSPYSGYRVGAAARLESGRIITSANQESAVFPAGLCAERVLLFSHLSSAPQDRIETMAIISSDAEHECRPCGECRQVMCDTEERQGKPFRIVMSCERSATAVASAAVLLPFPFEM